jgi:hypothetical protein
MEVTLTPEALNQLHKYKKSAKIEHLTDKEVIEQLLNVVKFLNLTADEKKVD